MSEETETTKAETHTPTPESDALGIRVCKRYDELRREGKHGHYETMIRVVLDEIRPLQAEIAELRAAKETANNLEDAVDYVFKKFRQDEAEGFRSRDRQFAIDILGKAREPRAALARSKP